MADTESNLLRRRMALIAILVTLVIVIAAIWTAFALLQPTPPRKVVMSTGADGSAYAHFGALYREILAREGIDLELRPSAGAVENLARLNDSRSGVSVAFTQGGTTDRTRSPNLETLGTLFY